MAIDMHAPATAAVPSRPSKSRWRWLKWIGIAFGASVVLAFCYEVARPEPFKEMRAEYAAAFEVPDGFRLISDERYGRNIGSSDARIVRRYRGPVGQTMDEACTVLDEAIPVAHDGYSRGFSRQCFFFGPKTEHAAFHYSVERVGRNVATIIEVEASEL